MDYCIFCDSNLDASDEHIIPQSINGQLHSKNLICSTCNNLFGVKIDPVLKENLSFILHALKIGNVRNMTVQNEKGISYLIDNLTGKIKNQKIDLKTDKLEDGKVAISITGPDNITTYKALATKAVRLFGHDALKGEFSASKAIEFNTEYSANAEIKITPRFLLALNKIILEYYCYCGLNKDLVKSLLKSVWKLDENLSNIKICNTTHNVRKPIGTEISHLVAIKSDNKQKIIYGYVELFNSICAFTVLCENYNGDNIDFVYRQDALTKEVLEGEIKIVIDGIENEKPEFEHNLNNMFTNYESRNVQEQISLVCEEIIKDLKQELDNGQITKQEYEKKFIERSTNAIAYAMVHVYPDAIQDFSPKELKEVNYIHSIIKADKIEEFKFFYHQFIGHEFKFEDDEAMYKLQEFVFAKHKPREGQKMLKVYCCFVSEKDGSKIYWLATDVFKYTGIPFLPNDFIWL